jgi:hypothetical protein
MLHALSILPTANTLTFTTPQRRYAQVLQLHVRMSHSTWQQLVRRLDERETRLGKRESELAVLDEEYVRGGGGSVHRHCRWLQQQQQARVPRPQHRHRNKHRHRQWWGRERRLWCSCAC